MMFLCLKKFANEPSSTVYKQAMGWWYRQATNGRCRQTINGQYRQATGVLSLTGFPSCSLNYIATVLTELAVQCTCQFWGTVQTCSSYLCHVSFFSSFLTLIGWLVSIRIVCEHTPKINCQLFQSLFLYTKLAKIKGLQKYGIYSVWFSTFGFACDCFLQVILA